MKKLYTFLPINYLPAEIALFLMRIYAGLTIGMAGLDKLPLPDWMTEQVVSMKFPFPEFFAWFASFGEFAFGILLVFGLTTRVASIFLALIMGTAAFIFQSAVPLVDMHIAQHFFWMFAVFAFIGGGRFSLDNLILVQLKQGRNIAAWSGIFVFALLLTFGLFKEFKAVESESVSTSETFVIESVNIAGSFNDWDPGTNNLEKVDDVNYEIIIQFDNPSPVQFKFTANGAWEYNLGILDQLSKGFPIRDTAILDQGGNTNNIEAYIPAPGMYIFRVNVNDYTFSLDSIPQ